GRVFVRTQNSDGLSGLNQQRLIILKMDEGSCDRVVRIPIPRRLARSSVDDQLLRRLRDVGIEIVHQHPKGRLLNPSLTVQLIAAIRSYLFHDSKASFT